jgi:hypothetical protein
MVTYNKLNDKGDFMSRKKIIMIFDTWVGFVCLAGKRIKLDAGKRYIMKAA